MKSIYIYIYMTLEEKYKIENINNFSLHLKIKMIIFIISYQMYYTDFYYISSNVLY